MRSGCDRWKIVVMKSGWGRSNKKTSGWGRYESGCMGALQKGESGRPLISKSVGTAKVAEVGIWKMVRRK